MNWKYQILQLDEQPRAAVPTFFYFLASLASGILVEIDC